MTDLWMLIGIAAVLVLLIVVLIVLIVKRRPGQDGGVYFDIIKDFLESQRKMLRDEMAATRKQSSEESANTRQELVKLFNEFNTSNVKSINEISKSNSERMDSLRKTVDDSLKNIQQSNDKKLDDMRKTVDEKLSETLEKRLNASLEAVTKQLMQVTERMAEVKTLAKGVGDLNNMLSNVKARGGWGEVQLEILISDMLTEQQYEKNYRVGDGTVEFAVKMPGRKEEPVYLPIDSKFPLEDYNRLLLAQKAGSVEGMEASRKKLYQRLRDEAKKISEKYISPPQTTEFAIMFLPVEGLYAEAIQAGIQDEIQNKYRVTVTGPTVLNALLNSLQMGFKTLTIEKRAAEVWNILGGIKKGFENFSIALEKTRNTLSTAQKHLDDTSKKTATIQRRLRKVEEFEDTKQTSLLDE